MLFNSIDFAVFLPIVFILYWFFANRSLKLQNVLIVVASYVFYGWWDWRFLSLIFVSTLIDYNMGLFISQTEKVNKRKLFLWISIIANIGFLGFFKYYNFFLENFIEAFSYFNIKFSAQTLKIILPVGISFYTFQTLSYTIDTYRRKLQPTKDFIAFAAFVSFFPQLVAGPIERATNLIPQFTQKRVFNYNYAVDGLRQILWGLFKKIVIADNCAIHVNEIFGSYDTQSGSTLLLGAILFAFQIYGDFSGYSDIAIGTARLFGFNLMQNFAFPYFSRDIAEFWRRWHISLSSWFRDYVYIPLGGSRGAVSNKIRNIFIIFLVSGFWHGANWTFLAWGFLNACFFLPLLVLNKNRKNIDIVAQNRYVPSFKEIFQIGLTFGLTVFAWIFFRAESIEHAFLYISMIFDSSLLTIPFIYTGLKKTAFCILLLLITEWVNRDSLHGLQRSFKNRWIRRLYYFFIVAVIFEFGANSQSFIYFQF